MRSGWARCTRGLLVSVCSKPFVELWANWATICCRLREWLRPDHRMVSYEGAGMLSGIRAANPEEHAASSFQFIRVSFPSIMYVQVFG